MKIGRIFDIFWSRTGGGTSGVLNFALGIKIDGGLFWGAGGGGWGGVTAEILSYWGVDHEYGTVTGTKRPASGRGGRGGVTP